MLRLILVHGLIAGAIVSAAMLGTVSLAHQVPTAYGMAIGYLSMLIALGTVFMAIKRQRDTVQGGVIRFWPALGIGLAITLVATICYAAAWEVALATMAGDFIDTYAAAMIREQQAAGASAAEIAKLTADMAEFKVQYADPLFRIPMTMAEILPVGVLVSLISAGLLCNHRFLPARREPQPEAVAEA